MARQMAERTQTHDRRNAAAADGNEDDDGGLLNDIFRNLKDGIESQLGCSVCSEVGFNVILADF